MTRASNWTCIHLHKNLPGSISAVLHERNTLKKNKGNFKNRRSRISLWLDSRCEAQLTYACVGYDDNNKWERRRCSLSVPVPIAFSPYFRTRIWMNLRVPWSCHSIRLSKKAFPKLVEISENRRYPDHAYSTCVLDQNKLHKRQSSYGFVRGSKMMTR